MHKRKVKDKKEIERKEQIKTDFQSRCCISHFIGAKSEIGHWKNKFFLPCEKTHCRLEWGYSEMQKTLFFQLSHFKCIIIWLIIYLSLSSSIVTLSKKIEQLSYSCRVKGQDTWWIGSMLAVFWIKKIHLGIHSYSHQQFYSQIVKPSH